MAKRLGADRLGHLVRIVSARVLELLHESNVLLLGLLGRGALVDDLLPGVLLVLALFTVSFFDPAVALRSTPRVCDGGRGGRSGEANLDVEHAGAGGLGDVLAGGDLEQSVELEELVVGGLGGELLGVRGRGLECFGGRHLVRCSVRWRGGGQGIGEGSGVVGGSEAGIDGNC